MRYDPRATRSLTRSALWSFGGDALGRIAMLGTLAVAAAELNPGSFGNYAALQAAALFVAVVWDAGTSQLAILEIAAGRVGGSEALRRIAGMRLALCPIVPFALFGGSYVALGLNAPSVDTFATVAAYCAFQNAQQVVVGVLRGQLRFRPAAVSTAWGRFSALLATATVAVAMPTAGISLLILALAFGELISTVIGLRYVDRRDAFSRGRNVITVRAALPFSVSALMVTAYNRLDTLVVAGISTVTVLAAYAPASRLQDALWIFPMAAPTVLFPILARSSSEALTSSVGGVLLRATIGSAGLSLIVALGVTVCGGPLIHLLAPEYSASIIPIQIIVWSLPIVAINAALMAALNALGFARLVPYGVLAALATSSVLLPLCISAWGANGAAAASALREVPAMVVLVLLLRRSGLRSASGRGNLDPRAMP